MGPVRILVIAISASVIVAATSVAASAGDSSGATAAPASPGQAAQKVPRPKEATAAAPVGATKRGAEKPPAASSNAPITGEKQMPPVVVTASRIAEPLSQVGTTVSVIDAEQIQSQKIQTAGDALSQVPGVQVTQSGSPGTVTDVSIRGATSAQTLVMVDGVELNTGATGSFDIANLTTSDLDRIEVVRGAGGALYGSQAIGGVINLITREGQGPPELTMLSEGGNRATERQVATLEGSQGRLGYSAAVNYFSTEGFRPVNDNSDNLSGALRLDYHLDDKTTIRGFARYFRSNVGLVNYSVFSGSPINPTAHQRNEFMLFNGQIERRLMQRLTTRVSAFFVRNDLRLDDYPYQGNSSFEFDRIPDEMRGTNAEADYSWADGWDSLAGFDFKDRWMRLDDVSGFPPFGTFSSRFTARRQEYAGYLEQQGRLLDGHLLGTAGLRVDGNSQFGTEVSPAWSVAIPISQIDTTLRGSYDEGFRAPSFEELYYPDYGNPGLAPELSSEYDGGFTTTFTEWGSFTATYFSRRVHNLIVAVPCSGGACPYGALAGNAGRVDVQGVELAPSLGPFYGLTLSGNFTLLDETHVSPSASARPLRVPKKSAFALAQYVGTGIFSGGDKLTLSLACTFVGSRDDITVLSTIAEHSSYERFDAVASYQGGMPLGVVSDEEIFVRALNVFDAKYSEVFGFPAPPINFVAGIKTYFF
jgi:vitamin B12 transporter